MNDFLLTAVVAFGITLAVTPVMRAISQRLGHLDHPSEKSSHSVPTPRSGGYAILLGIVIGAGVGGGYADRGVVVMAVGAVVLACFATIDDATSLPRSARLVFQICAAAALTYVSHEYLQRITLPFGIVINLGAAAVVASLFWIVGLINGYNFMDGLNGLASAEGIIMGATLSLLFQRVGDTSGAVLSVAIAAACAAFLPWNLPSGSIFMGDVGSASLGFLFALLTLRAVNKGIPPIAAALPLLPFLFDSGVSLVRRAIKGERFFSTGHRSHLYQRLNKTGWTHAQVTGLWSAGGALCALLAIKYVDLGDVSKLVAVAAVISLHIVAAIWISHRERKVNFAGS